MAAQVHTIPAALSAIAPTVSDEVVRLLAGTSRLQALHNEAADDVTEAETASEDTVEAIRADLDAPVVRARANMGISRIPGSDAVPTPCPDLDRGPGLPTLAPLPSLVSALSRRSAIFGAVVVGAVPAAALAANAGDTRISPDPDAELIALGREWQASAAKCDRASDALLEAEERIVFPEPPEALFRRSGDALALVLRAGVHRSGRLWYGAPTVAEDLRGLTFRDAASRPVASDVARRDEIVGAMEEWDEACRAERQRSGADTALVEEKAANAENSDLRHRIVLAQAHTLAGLLAKARVAGWWLNGSAEMRAEAVHAIDIGNLSGEAMAFSIAADLAAMAEREAA